MIKGVVLGKISVLAVGTLLALAACASTKPFLGFIATTGYVDQKMQAQSEANRKSLETIQADLQTLRADLGRFQDQTDQIKQIMDEIDKTRSQTQQLEQLAASVGDRLAGLPRETLLQLADLIQKNLTKDTATTNTGK